MGEFRPKSRTFASVIRMRATPVISQIGTSYYWASRENVQLSRIDESRVEASSPSWPSTGPDMCVGTLGHDTCTSKVLR